MTLNLIVALVVIGLLLLHFKWRKTGVALIGLAVIFMVRLLRQFSPII